MGALICDMPVQCLVVQVIVRVFSEGFTDSDRNRPRRKTGHQKRALGRGALDYIF